MKIAMFTNNYKPFIGGVPISIERLAKGLREIGHTVYIFAPSYDNQIDEDFLIRYKSRKKRMGVNKFVVPNILDYHIEKEFKHLDFDIIHVHHPMLIGNVALHLGKKYNLPVVFTYHTRYEQYLHNIKVYNFLEEKYKNEKINFLSEMEGTLLNYTKERIIPAYIKMFLNKCDTVFAPTNLIKDYLKDVGVESKLAVMPTGLDKSYFSENKEETIKIRNTYKGDKNYLFSTVSRLTKEKNIEFIIDGVKLLKDRVGDCFNLMIIGDGPLKNSLQERARQLEVDDNIIFLNSVSNECIGDYYRASDIFLFASKSETQGIVLLEAMAANNPVIAIKATGVADVVENGVNGYMTSEDTNQWVEKIILLMMNEGSMETMKSGAYNTALKYVNSSIAKIAEKNYENAIATHNKPDYYMEEGYGYNVNAR
ncbi:MAG: glycosyltransferase [Clostridium sp.]|uniref:glycosyltransferase n=1 Tax=Clostridium sp. TaxID=1506 RepID=UPI00301EEC1F